MRRNDFQPRLSVPTLLLLTTLAVPPQLAQAGGKHQGGGHGGHSGRSSGGGHSHSNSHSNSQHAGSMGKRHSFPSANLPGLGGIGSSQPWSHHNMSTHKSFPNQLRNNPGNSRLQDHFDHLPGNGGHGLPNVQLPGDFAKHHGEPLRHVSWKDVEHQWKHVNGQGLQQQFHNALRCAPPHIVRHTHCHWWFRYVCGSYACAHRPWVCDATYWQYWTPCRYYTVAYNRVSYYIGMECTLIPDLQGLGVQAIQGNSPADLAGLQPGDILLSVNGRPLNSGSVLTEELPTRSLTFEVLREGADAPVVITVIPRIVVSAGSY